LSSFSIKKSSIFHKIVKIFKIYSFFAAQATFYVERLSLKAITKNSSLKGSKKEENPQKMTIIESSQEN
jgi:hypothetical protein